MHILYSLIEESAYIYVCELYISRTRDESFRLQKLIESRFFKDLTQVALFKFSIQSTTLSGNLGQAIQRQ